MSDLQSVLMFFGIVAIIFVLFLTKEKNFLKKFLEDPKKKVHRRYINGEISYEEYKRKMAHLESCG